MSKHNVVYEVYAGYYAYPDSKCVYETTSYDKAVNYVRQLQRTSDYERIFINKVFNRKFDKRNFED